MCIDLGWRLLKHCGWTSREQREVVPPNRPSWTWGRISCNIFCLTLWFFSGLQVLFDAVKAGANEKFLSYLREKECQPLARPFRELDDFARVYITPLNIVLFWKNCSKSYLNWLECGGDGLKNVKFEYLLAMNEENTNHSLNGVIENVFLKRDLWRIEWNNHEQDTFPNSFGRVHNLHS